MFRVRPNSRITKKAVLQNVKRLQRPALRPAQSRQLVQLHETVLEQKSSSSATLANGAKKSPHHPQNIEPSFELLRQHFFVTAIPMVGFGIMDQTIMLHAGNAIDCTLGVTLGLSTLAAAAFGQIVANAGSVLFGGAVERAAYALGFPAPHFTSAQRRLPVVQRTATAGTFFGVILGCTIGLLNLFFIDTRRTEELKMAAALTMPYEIEVTNAERPDATVITIRGPDRKGLLAAIANAFRDEEVSLVEVNARPAVAVEGSAENQMMVEDVFVVQDQNQQMSDDRLQKVALALQRATSWPQPVPSSEPNT